MNPTGNIVTFKSFSKIPGLVHGFSTRKFGSMRPSHVDSEKSLKLFCKSLKINPQNIVRMRQVHGDNIIWVNAGHKGQWIDPADGMITEEKDLYLSILTADCLPIFIFDTTKKYPGVVHAGWRGIYNEILIKASSQLRARGSSPGNLIVGIGPCIRACCYYVDGERLNMFRNKFTTFSNFVYKRNGKTYLDLVLLARSQLRASGVLEQNIEDCGICTSDNTDRLFSFRKEGANFGEFIGIIGRNA